VSERLLLKFSRSFFLISRIRKKRCSIGRKTRFKGGRKKKKKDGDGEGKKEE